jgi:hypothetical protein
MALQPLLDLIAREGTIPRGDFLARWTETPVDEPWDAEPSYGAFVDDQGLVVSGTQQVRVSLETDDPRFLVVDPTLEFSPDSLTVFVDWGRQSLSWEEIFALWEAWDAQGMVLDCGAVGVPWAQSSRWVAPGWVVFRDGFDGAPLTTVAQAVRELPATSVMPEEGTVRPEATSFLARARQLRGEELPHPVHGERLPMLPFTLDSLKDPAHLWPLGAA